jgi:hypothetical protein
VAEYTHKKVDEHSTAPAADPILGAELTYDDGFSPDGAVDSMEWDEQGGAAAKAKTYGLPHVIHGNPLGCYCHEAYLHGIGNLVNGHIECDYMCDAGWHNYIVFEVREKKRRIQRPRVKKDKVLLDLYGNPMKDKGFTAGELEQL